ncbi:MAG: hypothetical protein ACRDRA_12365 [Pseudonocardiaceae bacterium]
MPAQTPRPAQDRRCHVDGTNISLFWQVEQVLGSTEPTALPSRLHGPGR